MNTADAQARLNRREFMAFMGALCLFLSVIEYLIPKPPPLFFFRIGIANIPILLALPVLGWQELFFMVFLKVLGQGLINGTLASYVFLFSATGSLASGLVMYGLFRLLKNRISLLGLSVAGALASNAIQVALSLSFVFGSSAWIIAPLFMGLGLGAGVATGIFALIYVRRSRWYSSFLETARLWTAQEQNWPLPQRPAGFSGTGTVPGAPERSPARRRRWTLPGRFDLLGRTFPAQFLFWWGLCLIPLYLFQHSLAWRCIHLAVLICMALGAGKRLKFLYFLSMISAITLFNLVVPDGKILLDVWGFHITQGALWDGLYKGVGIVGLVLVSLSTVRKNLVLPGGLGAVMGRMFWANEFLMTRRHGLSLRGLVQGIDHALFDLGEQMILDQAGKPQSARHRESTVVRMGGFALFLAICSIFILPWIISLP